MYVKCCRICKSHNVKKFLSHPDVPVHQNFLINDQKLAIGITRGDLDLMVCEECGFIFNQNFDLSKLSYGINYDNTQDYSPSFNTYVSNLARSLIFDKNVKNCSIVEIGCGKGSFLRKLVDEEEWKNKGYGFDPSYVGLESDLDGRLKFEKCFYDQKCANIHADVVICRHVIEHVPDPLNLLRTIRQALIHSPQARVFFETPSVEWILQKQVIWDFFYEHCSYFTVHSLITAFEMSGFHVDNVNHVFEGQYLWLEATISTKKADIIKDPGNIPSLAKKFAESEMQNITEWKNKVQNMNAHGKVAIWGAGAKGVTFANLIDPKHKWIDCIIDLNPKKHGKYIPGTGHEIVSHKDITSRKIKTAILMNPNYYNEITELLDNTNLNVDLIV